MSYILGSLLMILLVLILAGCGGGGKSNGDQHWTNPIPLPHQNIAKVGFFMGNPEDLDKYAGDVDYVFTNDWGNWDTYQFQLTQNALLELQHAKQLGVKEGIVSMGFLVFDSKYQVKKDAILYLQNFKTQLEALGLDSMVKTFYVIDEPDLQIKKHNLTEVNLIAGIHAIKYVFPDIKLMVIYSNSGNFPAKDLFDFVGLDDYGAGDGALKELPVINANQAYVIVPGGANPWKQDPTPFVEFSKQHDVAYIVAFLYSDYSNNKGIGTNGMYPAYQKAFNSIRSQHQ